TGSGGRDDDRGSVGDSARGQAIIDAARTQLGARYTWGGESPGTGFDCSGLVHFAYNQAGVDLPRKTAKGYVFGGRIIPKSQARPGDLVAFPGNDYGHMGIYVGNGKIIVASGSRQQVVERSILNFPHVFVTYRRQTQRSAGDGRKATTACSTRERQREGAGHREGARSAMPTGLPCVRAAGEADGGGCEHVGAPPRGKLGAHMVDVVLPGEAMHDPLALGPLPQSVGWSDGTWETSDPWEGLSVGLNDALDTTEYALSISPTGASLSAGSEAALADGRNTFAQIVTGANGSIPCVTISDRPKYAWRGMHLDVSRHFLPPEEIETLIDAMALHRLNVLHLHLTDDQG